MVVAGHHRGQREHRRHRRGRPAAGAPARGGARRAPGREGPGPRAQAGVDRLRRGRARLHGRRPVHRPQRAAAARRAADQRPLGPRHRQPAAGRLAGDPRPEARGDLPRLQPPGARRRCAPGSPTRSAGSRRSAATSPARCLPLVEDDAWFFDTELLVLAERAGLRIHEVPVDWVDDPDSRVDILRTAYDDVRGIVRLGRNLVAGRIPLADVTERFGRASADAHGGRLGMQLVLFAVVGVLSTVAYAAALPRLPRTCRRAGREPPGPAAHRGRQHRGQPALHLRRPRPDRPAAAPAAGPGDLRRRPRRHERVAVAAARARARRVTASRSLVLTVANLVGHRRRFVALRTWVFVHGAAQQPRELRRGTTATLASSRASPSPWPPGPITRRARSARRLASLARSTVAAPEVALTHSG